MYISFEVSLACHFTGRGPNNFEINQYRKVSKRLVVRTVGRAKMAWSSNCVQLLNAWRNVWK